VLFLLVFEISNNRDIVIYTRIVVIKSKFNPLSFIGKKNRDKEEERVKTQYKYKKVFKNYFNIITQISFRLNFYFSIFGGL